MKFDQLIDQKQNVTMIVSDNHHITGRIVEKDGDFLRIEVQNQLIDTIEITGYISARISDITMFWEESHTVVRNLNRR